MSHIATWHVYNMHVAQHQTANLLLNSASVVQSVLAKYFGKCSLFIDQ